MQITLVYKSKSGLTQRYAQWLAEETGCLLLPLQAAGASNVRGCDILIFGSRMYAGRLDGLAKARKLFAASGAKHKIVFATGAMPTSAVETIDAMWSANLTGEELAALPHFYFPAGICLEKLGLMDKAMLKLAASAIAKQPEKSPMEEQILKATQGSYDLSDRQYITPLVELLRSMG